MSSFDAYYVEDGVRHLRFAIDRDERPDGVALVPPPDTWALYAPGWARDRREDILAWVVPTLAERGFAVEEHGRTWSPTVDGWQDGALPAAVVNTEG